MITLKRWAAGSGCVLRRWAAGGWRVGGGQRVGAARVVGSGLWAAGCGLRVLRLHVAVA